MQKIKKNHLKLHRMLLLAIPINTIFSVKDKQQILQIEQIEQKKQMQLIALIEEKIALIEQCIQYIQQKKQMQLIALIEEKIALIEQQNNNFI